jgi:hypothetical protein
MCKLESIHLFANAQTVTLFDFCESTIERNTHEVEKTSGFHKYSL